MRPRLPRSTRFPMLAACLVGGLLGCGEDAGPPSAPDAATAPTSAAAAAPAFRSLSAGWDHSCGITSGTRAWCWGGNAYGQLGTWNKIRQMMPVPTKGDLPFATVEAGNFNSCGVTTAADPYCWGQNLPTDLTTRPTLADPALDFVQITAGYNHSCGITAEGAAWCRGDNTEGRLGDGSTTDRSEFVPVTGGHVFRQISTSDYHTCALATDDRAWCWGDNYYSELGIGTPSLIVSYRPIPVEVKTSQRFRTITAGNGFTCAIALDDRAWCWGSNLYGQIGDETLIDRTTPTLVHGGKRWLQLEAGNSHVCGVNVLNRGFCWGRGAEGQRGTGVYDGIDNGMKPEAVAGGLSWRQIAPGGLHTCGVTTADVAYCWGYNNKGQLGDGTRTSRAKPTKVVGAG